MTNYDITSALGGSPQPVVGPAIETEEYRSTPAHPPLGSEVRIDSCHLRMLGLATTSLVLAYASPPHALFLMPDQDGVPALVSQDLFWLLAAEGRAEVLTFPKPANRRQDASTRLATTCDLLEAAGVRNGTKAIAIWLHRNWSADLKARFGEPDNPHTIRRWRSLRITTPPD